MVARRYAQLIGRLIDARYAAEMSVREVGAACGVSIATITGIENGSSWPRLVTLQTIAGALDRAFTVYGNPDLIAVLDAEMVRKRQATKGQENYMTTAREVSLQPNTVARLTVTSSPSMATVLLLAHHLHVLIGVTRTDLGPVA